MARRDESDNQLTRADETGEPPVLPGDVPVVMPELPLRLAITTEEQHKAIGDPTRSRILAVIQHQPATAKQIADRLGLAPGTVGHHLGVLAAAGLVKVVARRLARGIVAKYYTRAARLFEYRLPHEIAHGTDPSVTVLTAARDELADALTLGDPDPFGSVGCPHARLSGERAREYHARLQRLIDDFAAEPPDPAGQVYGLCGALFRSPPYAQVAGDEAADAGPEAARE